jgi:hypothetical protein
MMYLALRIFIDIKLRLVSLLCSLQLTHYQAGVQVSAPTTFCRGKDSNFL